ncbi:MAG: bifunctional 5,10-methylene-tetrahydrofolate dehydrogenase/5,10-methylene-tetrahydrofolate cyclohydrolase [bacterium]|nr:bifunctional 5,10-methylene-tetrahydrofolate dehydrogenase/5,10-methylene-tetrahydrofolate cyclohydrolase [bacterium]
MSATLLSGKDASAAVLQSLESDIASLDPKLVVVQVGEDPASSSYIKQKFKSCQSVGMRSEHKHMPATTTLDELMHEIVALNADPDVSGFIVQLPLPAHLEKHVPDIIKSIEPRKDVDGFGAYNLGKMFLNKDFEDLPPATPSGIILLLDHYNIDVAGKHVVVVGRSNIVGKPVSMMLLNRSATVTICHSKTKDLGTITRQADILIAAVGRPKMITADMVKDGVVVIDVGMNRTDDGLCGDVDFDAVAEKASAITPVPGGVGPMTVASLIRNCVRAAQRQE